WRYQSDLNDDRDAYLAIARQLREHGDFASTPGGLTSYRPPLYPLLLTYVSGSKQTLVRGIFHACLSLGTILLVWQAGIQLQLSRFGRLAAAGICAFDPVLLRYLAFPMTETLSAFLSIFLVVLATRHVIRQTLIASFSIGVVFGLNVLCRPSFWAFGGLIALAWFITNWLPGKSRNTISDGPKESPLREREWPKVLILVAGVAVTVSPWVIRNALVLGVPVVMTTHGGYTVLLGNNDAFYDEVVKQPYGTVWDGSHGPGQSVWVTGIQKQMQQAGVTSEVDQDDWMTHQARETMMRRPTDFLRACLLRQLRFWSVLPGGEWTDSTPRSLILFIAGWYITIWLSVAVGVGKLIRVAASPYPHRFLFLSRWMPVFLMVFAIVGVHLLYWTNTRMRAPVMPEIALIAGLGAEVRRQRDTREGL
ncbi:MAG: hypothetical protein KDA80_03950, partial [Planctomycetaceae bacterium]|nr:hypothetical protein [Planctomycetaceae bacterium]